jgi:hypothetical protein
MMVLVALAGVGLAAFRLHPALGCFVSSMLCLALIRTSRRIDHLRAMESSIRPSETNRTMIDDPARALELLRLGTANSLGTFRDGQEEAIRNIFEGRWRS